MPKATATHPVDLAVATTTGAVGFIVADGLDRFLSSYNPSSTAPKPTDRFTSDGAGTLGNALNVASAPGALRIAAGIGMTAVPAVASTMVDDALGAAALEGVAIGAGVSTIKMLVQNLLLPMLVPKDATNTTLQRSYVARLYPASVAARLYRSQQPSTTGALSGADDPGPYASQPRYMRLLPIHALADSSPYMDTAQALQAGLNDSSVYPDSAEALLRQQAGLRGSSPYPDSHEALRRQAGVSYQPGPPDGPGPGPQDPRDHEDPDCGCAGSMYDSFLGDAPDRGSNGMIHMPMRGTATMTFDRTAR